MEKASRFHAVYCMSNSYLYFNYSTTIQAFTRADSRSQIPAFTTTDHDIINVKSHRGLTSHVDTRSIYIINIRLLDLPGQGSPAHLMYLSLLPYFSGPDEGHLHYFDAPFAVEDLEDAEKFQKLLHEALVNLAA